MTVTLIAALDQDHAIGRSQGGLPWHVPDETAHFRAYCAGQWLLVGRRTLEEMTGWFQPGHSVILLTSRPHPPPPPTAFPILIAATVPDAIATARHAAAPELVVIGGARTYTETLPHADRLVLSRLALRSGGTLRFPAIDPSQWSLHHREPERQDRTSGTRFHIEHWERQRA
jgi:dihydrofolate reductase